MKYQVGSFKPYSDNDKQQFYIYLNDDVTNRICIMVGDYSTEHAASVVADALNKQSSNLYARRTKND